ncbi:MAG: hypothetical protein P4L87_26785 [Formivibrio sp.]|nr:hypothetical protein [Formivibrio sp.]
MGHFLELTKYLNHAEFLCVPSLNWPGAALMTGIKRITFEHNLIIVTKGRNEEPSVRSLLER